MKKLFVLLFCIVNCLGLFAQNKTKDFVVYDTTLYTNSKVGVNDNEFHTSLCGDTLYFLSQNAKSTKGVLPLNVYIISQNKYYTVNINLGQGEYSVCDKRKLNIYKLLVNNDNLYLASFFGFVTYKKNKDNNYDFVNLITRKENFGFQDSYILPDNKILFVKNYLHSHDSLDKSTSLTICNVKKLDTIKSKFVDFPIPILTYFSPRDVFAKNKDNFFYSIASDYKIYVYDFELNKVDSIILNKKDWKGFPKDTMDKVLSKSHEIVDIIYRVSDLHYHKYNSIFKIIVSDDLFMVVYNSPNNRKDKIIIQYDIWKKKEGKWNLALENILDEYNETDYGDKKGLFVYNTIILSDNYVVRLRKNVPLKREDFESDKKYQKAYERAVLDDKNEIIIDRFKIVLK